MFMFMSALTRSEHLNYYLQRKTQNSMLETEWYIYYLVQSQTVSNTAISSECDIHLCVDINLNAIWFFLDLNAIPVRLEYNNHRTVLCFAVKKWIFPIEWVQCSSQHCIYDSINCMHSDWLNVDVYFLMLWTWRAGHQLSTLHFYGGNISITLLDSSVKRPSAARVDINATYVWDSTWSPMLWQRCNGKRKWHWFYVQNDRIGQM